MQPRLNNAWESFITKPTRSKPFSLVFPCALAFWAAITMCWFRISPVTCSTYLILYRHHQNASNFEQYFHVIFMVLLHSSATINAIVLVAVCGDFKAIPHHKDRFTELKPVKEIIRQVRNKIMFLGFFCKAHHICRLWQKYTWEITYLRRQTVTSASYSVTATSFSRGHFMFWGIHLLAFFFGRALDKRIDSHSHVFMINMQLEPAGG